MFIRFHSIRFKNILSAGNSFITLRLDKDDMTLLIGKNGQGKSLLLDALCFALYNKAFRKINKPQLVNSINKKELLVEIAFSIGSNTYVVRRGMKPDVFEIYRNRELIPQNAETGDYQTYLEKQILGTNYKTFTQVNILGKASYIPFMELKPQQRREVVEDLLDSQIFTTMSVLAKDELKSTSNEYRELDKNIQITEAKIEAAEKLVELRNQDKESKLESIKNDISIADVNILRVTADLKSIIDKKELAQSKMDGILKDPVKAREAMQALLGDKRSLNDQKLNIQTQLKRLDVDKCPVCQQKIDENHKNHINSESESNINEINTKLSTVDKRLVMIKDLLDQYQEKQREALSICNEENVLNERLRNLEVLRNGYEKQLSEAQTNIESSGSVMDVTSLRDQLRDHSINYDVLSKEIQVLKRVVSHLGDDGIKAKLVSKYIPTINNCINTYLEKMDLFVQFELDEQFNETIKSRYRDTFSYSSFSEGEKLRIDLALLLAWRQISKKRNSVSTNLLILDEVLDGSFDADGVRDFMNILNELLGIENIIVISHKSEVIDGFDNIIRAEKTGTFTEYNRLDARA